MHSVAIAWYNLTHSRRRLLTSVAGITFAIFLMFAEVGFRNGLYDSQVELVNQLSANIIMTNKLKYALFHPESFPRQRLYQAMATPGVKAVYPLYLQTERPLWRSVETRQLRPIRVLAFRPSDPIFLNPDIRRHAIALQLPDTALIDTQSKGYFGPRRAGVVAELADKTIRVVGTFRLGTDFINEGTVVMSDSNFLKYFATDHDAQSRRDKVDLGIIQVVPAANPAAVVAALRQVLPADVAIYTKAEYFAHEMRYWQTSTAIGAIFGLGTAMGFLIGIIICYQILYTDVVEHLAQFATMRAIGYYNPFLVVVVVAQAIVLAFLGFVPGLLLSQVFYHIVASATGLLMRLTVLRAAAVLVLTVVMCAVAGSLAIRNVLSTDPAEVF
jgi:putative ABC transport system permease protein